MKTRGNDPGRIPQHLADNPLNQAERIVISKYVVFGNMNKMNISGGNKLYGHVIAIPLDKDIQKRAVAGMSLYRSHVIFHKELKLTDWISCSGVTLNDKRTSQLEEKLPRMKFSEFCKMSFFGEDKTWHAIRKLAGELGHVKIRPARLEMWMEALEMHEELKRFRDNRAQYIKSWAAEECVILDNAIVNGDNVAQEYERGVGSDVAKMRPQMDGNDDADTEHDATPGISNSLLMSTTQEISSDFLTHAKRLFTSSGEEQINVDLKDELENEFLVNPEIISGGFPDLLPLGATSVLLGGTGTVHQSVIRLPVRARPEYPHTRQYDPLSASHEHVLKLHDHIELNLVSCDTQRKYSVSSFIYKTSARIL